MRKHDRFYLTKIIVMIHLLNYNYNCDAIIM